MDSGKIDFSALSGEGVSWTLLGTLYLRAWENRLPHPILGDRYAAEALERIDYDFAPLKRRLRPNGNQFLVALRARQLDDWCTGFLTRHPAATVLHLGCGLDSRMLRLDPQGTLHWFDLDVPTVIGLRRRLYPEQGHYRLVGASVTDDGWLDQIPADRPVLIVAEGLFPYLTATEVQRLLRRLTDHFPTGELLFDGLAPWTARMGRLFRWGVRDGHDVERMNPRLTLAEQVPITEHRDRIPLRRYRLLYDLMNTVPALRNASADYRFTF
ncbi:class I SAM-dependent methyltransferase [Actinomadura harenae]|uniref:Class I SAM-dependent methyltransferase n=1 Tax=Actinomadura harenae TaxID=2483351 RepID=A0A3M2LXK1_9ACTN|nr:class I SAM-dependent methyltransferase [Actinomadura harenae]RMI42119.1 class I SAM-dependent methyltransferase [Actinomadura harenae]